MHSLTELPYDVIQLIAVLLLPYDILALSRTCHTLKPILLERSVWLQVAETVSRSRPLPYTATQALDLSIEKLIGPCLRAERIAKRWAEPHIFPRTHPVKISFPDNRIVTYFTFLPGSRHLMVYDVHNVLSCWTTDGQLLESWRAAQGAKLTRWKPCDESESNYDFEDRHMQAVEIMIEMPGRSRPTRCDIILLIYAELYARFEPVNTFNVPRVYGPFSAMTQDELRGSLVGINSVAQERVGIYLTDKNTEKAVCIDTGLTLVLDCVPQALLSSSHMVLYWETLASAHTFTYEMDVLRSVLAREGRSQDDDMLRYPVPVPPSDVRATPFRTVSAPVAEHSASSSGAMHRCSGCGMRMEQVSPSTDLSRNRDAYPVIIPKWHTLREDLRRHRTRSILTFSRRPPSSAQTHAQAVALYVNAHNLDVMNLHLVNEGAGPDLYNDVPAANGDDGPQLADDEQAAPVAHHDVHYISRSPHLPRTTITHHYFDYTGSASGCGPPELIRTVLAEAPLRRPQSLRIPRYHVNTVVMEAGGDEDDENDENDDGGMQLDGFGIEHIGGYADENEDQPAGALEADDDDGVEFQGFGFHDIGIEQIGAYDDEEDAIFQAEDNLEYEHQHGLDPNQAPGDEDADFDDLAALENDLAGLGLELGDLQDGGLMHVNPGVGVMGLDADAAQALEEFVQDPFGGSPVMGYGGRCAMWVEEHPREYRPNGRSPVLRIATFPSYEPSFDAVQEGEKGGALVHPELEVARGRVGTLHLPGYVSLESAYTFDLDDVRGVVGIATSFGEVWLVDFS